MHVVFRESRGLGETAVPHDPAQDPADLVVLSFSDSDLGALAAARRGAAGAARRDAAAAGWKAARGALPTLRLASLEALRHPLAVDVYAERTLAGARAVLVRLVGGAAAWRYGLDVLAALARGGGGPALAVVAGDGRPDPALDAASTLPVPVLRRLAALLDRGGPDAAARALAELASAAGLAPPPADAPEPEPLPAAGFHRPGVGALAAPPPPDGRPEAVVVFYRSYLLAADTAPVDALIAALEARGFSAYGVFVASLKDPDAAAFVRTRLAGRPLAAIVSATAFSARGDDGTTPFDGLGVPVHQVALSTARRRDWAASTRGLSPADLAMHVVLPEVDGRLFAGVVSFKAATARDPDTQFSRFVHRPDPGRVAAIADRIAARHRLAATPAAGRRIALVLSTYPGRPHRIAHAVGLDALASAAAVLDDLAAAGHRTAPAGDLVADLLARTASWPVAAYEAALAGLPEAARAALAAAWGPPAADAAVTDGAFRFAATARGDVLVALQPERGDPSARAAEYHDLARPPRHGYVAFHLWLAARGTDALVHMGAHGTLEWLPGKAVALGPDCWPDLLAGAMPVVYPFVVNDPGEAAQARRRIGAVTLGHLPPPLVDAALPADLAALERLLDEWSTADGLDPARRDRLVAAIRAEAEATGVAADLGLPANAAPAEALPAIDRFVCDLKESRHGDGLHVFGRGPCGREERDGLLAALAGRPVAAGPSGSPWRGRTDVLPTGRNLYAVDPRAVPTPAAHAQGVRLAGELVRRHLQDEGDLPASVVVDLWGSSTMRTAGEDFAMALALAGLEPVWDHASGRVTGVAAIPPALLGRPRIDVTLRVSGLFRDVFPGLAQLFELGCDLLAGRDEADGDNPYRRRAARVFGPAPGRYGAGVDAGADLSAAGRERAGRAFLAASSHAIGLDGESRPDAAGLAARLAAADAFVHAHDLAETDILLAADHAAHTGGFAAARAVLGAPPARLWHLDVTRADDPRVRALGEELARVVRARATRPAWIAGMMRHGFRGAAEIVATAEHLAAFAHLTGEVPAQLFDRVYDATLGDAAVAAFLARENPAGHAALADLFRRLRDAGLWTTRRNSIAAALEPGETP